MDDLDESRSVFGCDDVERRRDWTGLADHDVLRQIARDYLPAVVDRIAASRVCRSWRRAILSVHPLLVNDDDGHKAPLRYGLPCLVYLETRERSFRLLDPIHSDHTHTIDQDISGLIVGSTAKILFSRHGWLLLMAMSWPPRTRTNPQDEKEDLLYYCDVFFLNILSKSRIELPMLKTRQVICSRFSFSDRPTSPSCVVVTFRFDMSVAVCRPGDAQWTIVETEHDRRLFRSDCLTNVVWSSSSGRFYCLDKNGNLGGFDPTRQSWTFTARQQDLGRRVNGSVKQYLVESGPAGELLRVCDVGNWVAAVYRFDAPTGRWVPVRDLGDRALFVGRQNSMSVVAPPVESMRGKVYFNAAVVDPRGGGDGHIVVSCSIIDPLKGHQEEEENANSGRNTVLPPPPPLPPAGASGGCNEFLFSAWVDLVESMEYYWSD